MERLDMDNKLEDFLKKMDNYEKSYAKALTDLSDASEGYREYLKDSIYWCRAKVDMIMHIKLHQMVDTMPKASEVVVDAYTTEASDTKEDN